MFTSIISFNLPSVLVGIINVIILALQTRKRRIREGEQGAQGHTANKCQSGAVYSGLSDSTGHAGSSPLGCGLFGVSAGSSEQARWLLPLEHVCDCGGWSVGGSAD